MLKTTIGWLRMIGMAEGVSYLLLLGVAMPMKYLGDMPWAVQYTGWAHGLLFILLWIAAAVAWARGLPTKLAGLSLVASVLPFGPFVIDGELKQAQGARR